MNIPFARVPMAGNEMRYLKEVLDSGWLTSSSKVKEFEERFAARTGARFAVAVNSCTAALHLALEAAGIGPGDRVLVPAMTFTASAEIVRYLGADPVFTDVDLESKMMNQSILKTALENHPDVKAIILVHYGGQVAEMVDGTGKGIRELCDSFGVTLIEDAAHAFPASRHGRHAGTFGKAGCFSFYANKTITTGEGGMLITDDEGIYNRVKQMRLHGIDRDVWKRYTAIDSKWEYDVIAPGYKYNMPDLNAAVGLAQLEMADEFRLARQQCAMSYLEKLQDIANIQLPVVHGRMEDHSWHLFPILVEEGSPVTRNELIRQLNERGIGTSVHYKPLYRMRYYKDKYDLQPEDFPVCEQLWRGIFSVPIYPGLNTAEIDYICGTIHSILV